MSDDDIACSDCGLTMGESRALNELEALRVDAELYRWLASSTHPENLRKLFNRCPLIVYAEVESS